MPYILPVDRALEFHAQENILVQAADLLRGATQDSVKAQDTRDFIAFLVDGVYGEECFAHSRPMANNLESSPQLVACANLLVANIAEIHGRDGGREGLLNYAITRLFNETYPSARYKDYNSIAGILTSLANMGHPGNIELLGMLVCCRDEYYRKSSAPYEDKKEAANGAVKRPDVPAPTEY